MKNHYVLLIIICFILFSISKSKICTHFDIETLNAPVVTNTSAILKASIKNKQISNLYHDTLYYKFIYSPIWSPDVYSTQNYKYKNKTLVHIKINNLEPSTGYIYRIHIYNSNINCLGNYNVFFTL